MYAIAAGHDECVKLMSDKGAQANQQDKVRPMCLADILYYAVDCVQCWGWGMLVRWSRNVNLHSRMWG